MIMRLFFIYLMLSAMLARAASPPLEFRDGDRVVFLGNTFIERAQSYGHLETLLTTALADRALTFRNLGWSGDTVYGDARSYFGPPKEGFDRLTKHLEEIKPHILIIAYGAVAAFDGEAGLPHFIEGYETLLAMCQKTGAKIVLMSPPPAENLPAPLPNQDAHNDRLALYRDAIRQLAKDSNHGFADVFGTLKEAWADLPKPLTENGIHYTEAGYAAIAPLIAKTLGVNVAPLGIEIDAATSKATLSDARMQAITASPQAVNVQLHPTNAVPRHLTVKVAGLADGDYVIANEHRKLIKTNAAEMAKGIALTIEQWNPSFPLLHRAIQKKNELFFHQWRPQNETYLFGFRKHEQGNNALEIPQFAPLIEEQEARIQSLKTANPLTLSINAK